MGIRVGKWHHYDNYLCDAPGCGFASLRLGETEAHIRQRHEPPARPPDPPTRPARVLLYDADGRPIRDIPVPPGEAPEPPEAPEEEHHD